MLIIFHGMQDLADYCDVFFKEVENFDNVGYPIAEILEDGSFYITKHAGTGGLL